MCSIDCFLGLLAILFPPLPVWVKRGICSPDSIINILLCVLGYFPGLLHAWYIILKYPEHYDCYAPVAQEAHYSHGGHGGHGVAQEAHYSRGGHHFYPPASLQNQHHQSHLQQQPCYPPQLQYNTFQQNAHASPVAGRQGTPNMGGRQPERYTRHEQQTPPETPALGPGEGSSQVLHGAPPSYASVVKGDHKVQTQD